MAKINFGNPLTGIKWLNLLTPNYLFGMTFKKNLDLNQKYLGFSFKSNEFGLRGPKNIFAQTVVCGTSYAMGLSVDNGKNWYELHESYNTFFNVGMPIGFKHYTALLESYYKGKYSTLVFIYHPNIWITNKNFFEAEKRNLDIFKYMRWQTSIFRVVYLYIRWLLKEKIKILLKKKTSVRFKNNKYDLNLKYSFFNTKDQKDIEQILKDFHILSGKFEQVLIYKVPIKEEIALKYCNSENLKIINKNYDEMWNIFQNSLLERENVHIYDFSDKFDLDDYLEQDTHWSEQGNAKFSQYLLKTLKSRCVC